MIERRVDREKGEVEWQRERERVRERDIKKERLMELHF